MAEYEQGSNQRFYATFVDYKGEAAIISGTPTIEISHINSGARTVDIGTRNMTLMSGAVSTYYYAWNIPAAADRTSYTAIYNAIYSGVNASTRTDAVGAFDFQVITRKFYDKKGGGFVQKISRENIWTKKEKEKVMASIELLLSENKKLVENKLQDLSKSISKTLTVKDDSKEFESIKKLLEETKEKIKAISEKKINTNDVKVVRELTELTKKVDTLSKVLGESDKKFDGLKEDVDDFKRAFVKSVSNEVVENYHGKN
ncbi:MAG TPA: hypothetical protein VMW36_06920 [Patescibacteria group bacterium]|nr:hypothetical protein [Patescibacteria group bacterium]